MTRADVAVVGLGNMGVSVLCACVDRGLSAVGIDLDAQKTFELSAGRTVVPERDAEDILARALKEARLHVSTSLSSVAGAELVFVGVQTPAAGERCDYRALAAVMRTLAVEAPQGQTIVIGSTVFPGAMATDVMPALESRPDLHVVYEPVFLRAGFGIRDYQRPGKLIAGVRDPHNVPAALERFFSRVVEGAPRYVSYQEAEWIKMVHNAWMCLKIAFANEVGALCGDWNVDGRTVMDLAFRESAEGRLLTMSHMMPGAPYSGPCLPKDAEILGGLLGASSHKAWFDVGVCTALRSSNDFRRRALVERWLASAQGSRRPLGIIGIAFRPEFNEVRGSLALDFFRAAQEAGRDVLGYDPSFEGIDRDAFTLAARQDAFVESLFPSIRHSLEHVWTEADSVVINRALTPQERERVSRLATGPRHILDLYGHPPAAFRTAASLDAISA